MAYGRRARTDYIVLHCTATRPNQDIGVKDVDKWHKAQGWPGVAYHSITRIGGKVERGSDVNACAYHAGGHWNNISIGIAYAGGVGPDLRPMDTLTNNPAQEEAFLKECRRVLALFPDAKFIGHNAVAQKACPSFDWIKWCKKHDLPYVDLRKPRKSAIAALLSTPPAAALNELPGSDTRTGLLDGIDIESKVQPLTQFFSDTVGSGSTGVFVTVAKLGLAAISVATFAFACYRIYTFVDGWLAARRNPPLMLDGDSMQPGA